MEDMVLSIPEIIIRLSIALLFGGAIGFERQYKNRPAGMRTHILVCMGACIIALIQVEIASGALRNALEYPELVGTLRSDEARLIAQVVSGVGFLGAGTIIVTKQSVTGLTTAASLWAIAGLGIAIGMGFYAIALTSFVGIVFALTVVKRIIHVPTTKKLVIQFIHRKETKDFLNDYFEKRNITIEDVNFDVKFVDDYRIYKNVYTIDLPKGLTYAEVIEELSTYKNITNLHLVSLST
ncbi:MULTISPECIES: MgtC/SapB family protein [Enterococcus]|uniref:Magnesium transporter MgtC n=1 Tax=Enterococcus mundtii TaxID=53346 RepID=A0A1A6G8M2_ENTMU|nr:MULTISPECIES: MgtC/SapB family protein [Enterococcus]MBE6172019.1 MgtC/SapB family protein [Enterococcus faecium]GEN18319.1 magnesium transporter MgtC [Ligilactobacillus acidipiscis]AUB53660.1 magnesium transporter MgtC [Enterococcus mundtii]AZP93674.1 MgtC/SapB family protein [Enterococcus mundtii]EOH65767.1 MgtC family protein [Enterococcus mundtii ATCC 882]